MSLPSHYKVHRLSTFSIRRCFCWESILIQRHTPECLGKSRHRCKKLKIWIWCLNNNFSLTLFRVPASEGLVSVINIIARKYSKFTFLHFILVPEVLENFKVAKFDCFSSIKSRMKQMNWDLARTFADYSKSRSHFSLNYWFLINSLEIV